MCCTKLVFGFIHKKSYDLFYENLNFPQLFYLELVGIFSTLMLWSVWEKWVNSVMECMVKLVYGEMIMIF